MAGFFEQNIVVIYFFYGLAFFIMGLVIWIESSRAHSSTFRLAYALIPLAGFGIIHGLHEWFEMFEILAASGAAIIPAWLLLPEVRIAHLIISFLLLTVFGIRLIVANRRGDEQARRYALLGGGGFLILWLVSVLVTWLVYRPPYPAMLDAADVLSRYTVGIPGAFLAAWAIWLEQRHFRDGGMTHFGRALMGAALALIIYGVVGQIFTRPSFLFPSTILNGQTFLDWFGFPVQLLRTVMAAAMAVFIVRALNVFVHEDQQRQEAVQHRTDALNRELQSAVQDLSLLFALSHRLAGTLDRKALITQALPLIVNWLPQVNAGMLLLRDAPDQSLELLAYVECDDVWAEVAERRIMAEKLGREVATTGQAAWIVERENVPLPKPSGMANLVDPDINHLDGRHGGHTIAMPIRVRGEVAGSLVVCGLYDAPPFSDRDVALARTIADQLSVAIENATLYSQVEAAGRLRGELLHQTVNAQEAERQRIARELHDGTGQTLTALGLGLAAVSESPNGISEQTRSQLREMRQLNDSAQQELHDVIADLRPSVLDNLGLVPALRGLVQDFQTRTDVASELIVQGKTQRMEPNIETTIFRIVQEALTNVAKHARADSVEVKLLFDDQAISLAVIDDGQGFDPNVALSDSDPPHAAWGLLGIQERAVLVGGSSRVVSQPGEGTAVYVDVPISNKEETHG